MATNLRVEAHGLKELARHFDHLPGVVYKAERQAFKRTSKWARTQGLRAMSAASNIPQKNLKKRSRAVVYSGVDGQVRIWLGTDPMAAAYAGKLVQQKKGAKVGKHKFPHAFVATMPSGHQGIFHRQGKSRLPIMADTIDVTIPDSELQRIAGEAQSKLLAEFGHQLEFYAERVRG